VHLKNAIFEGVVGEEANTILVIIHVEYPCFTYIGLACFCKSSTRLEHD